MEINSERKLFDDSPVKKKRRKKNVRLPHDFKKNENIYYWKYKFIGGTISLFKLIHASKTTLKYLEEYENMKICIHRCKI